MRLPSNSCGEPSFLFWWGTGPIFLWQLLVGIVYVVGGGYLAFHPGLTLKFLTLVLAAILLVDGVLEIAVGFLAFHRSGWILLDAIVALLLAYLVRRHWLSGATWAIGILVGIKLIVSGFTVLMDSLADRYALAVMRDNERFWQARLKPKP